MKVYLGHTQYNSFKGRWECRITAEHDDGHIAEGKEVVGTTKSDTSTDALTDAGEMASKYNTDVLLES